MPVEPEQRRHWEKEDRQASGIKLALLAQTAALIAVIGGGFYWAGDTSRLLSTQGDRIAVLEADRTLRIVQSERMAVVETKLESVVESQGRLEDLLKEALGRDAEPKRR